MLGGLVIVSSTLVFAIWVGEIFHLWIGSKLLRSLGKPRTWSEFRNLKLTGQAVFQAQEGTFSPEVEKIGRILSYLRISLNIGYVACVLLLFAFVFFNSFGSE